MTPRRPLTLTALTFAFATGCDAPPAAPAESSKPGPPPAVRESLSQTLPQAARPDPTRLEYAPDTRTLTFYPLADTSARWVLTLPGRPAGVPVDGEFAFPPSMPFDFDQVQVFVTAADQRPSAAVSLREIVDAHAGRAGG